MFNVNNTVNKSAAVNTKVNKCQDCEGKDVMIAELRKRITDLEGVSRPTDRKAYMRDYMRRKRAGL